MKLFGIVIVVAGAVLATVYGALVFFDNYFPHGRMWETPAVRPHEEPILVMEKDLVPFNGGEAFLRDAQGEGLASPLNGNTPEILEMGKKAYMNYCVFCHGKNHDGMGTVGQSFHPLPSNLKSPRVMAQSDGALFYAISFGKGRAPDLATTVAVEDRWAVIHYLRSLNAGSEPVSSPLPETSNSPGKK